MKAKMVVCKADMLERRGVPASSCTLHTKVLDGHAEDVEESPSDKTDRSAVRPVHIITLELPRCEMKGQDTEMLAGLLTQYLPLSHLSMCQCDQRCRGMETLSFVVS